MTYADDIESDFSVYHRVDDFWCCPADWVMRFAPKLPAYGGALFNAMSREERPPAATTAPLPGAGLSTAYPQPVDSPADGDTPPEVVAQMWQQAIVADYQSKGFQVDGIESISADEMRAMLDG